MFLLNLTRGGTLYSHFTKVEAEAEAVEVEAEAVEI
jgi:hypothetical protein